MTRRWLLVIGGAALAVAAVCAVELAVRPGSPSGAQASSAPIGGPFTLVDDHGRTVTDRNLAGKPTAIFFGFTFCPEVCPTTLADLSADLKTLGPDADKLNVVYVTVDPERDTPKQMRAYLSAFDPRIIGLTGTPAEVARIAKEYDVYYKKIPLPGGGYTMDHSAGVYLMDRNGHFVQLMSYQEPPAEEVAKLRDLLRS